MLTNATSNVGEPNKHSTETEQAICESRTSIPEAADMHFHLQKTLFSTIICIYMQFKGSFRPVQLLFRKFQKKAVSANTTKFYHFERRTSEEGVLLSLQLLSLRSRTIILFAQRLVHPRMEEITDVTSLSNGLPDKGGADFENGSRCHPHRRRKCLWVDRIARTRIYDERSSGQNTFRLAPAREQ